MCLFCALALKCNSYSNDIDCQLIDTSYTYTSRILGEKKLLS